MPAMDTWSSWDVPGTPKALAMSHSNLRPPCTRASECLKIPATGPAEAMAQRARGATGPGFVGACGAGGKAAA